MGEQGSSLPSFLWWSKGITDASFLCFQSRRRGDRTKSRAGAVEDVRQTRVRGQVAWRLDTDASEQTSGSGGRLVRWSGEFFVA
jgi:hypothetical protein